MDKALCDKIICEYTDKLFGFAMTKTRSIRRAEELASRITLEVYASLLRRDTVTNIPAYIYRVAQNVWARHTDEYRRSPYVNIDDGDVWDGEDFTEQVEQSETYAKLRTEIAHLSETRREILVLHYYENMKLEQIAAKLRIPLGTVKWHLHSARNELKEGMDIMRSIGTLGINPIEFCSMGHDGHPGSKGDTADFFARRLTQNIAYAAYFTPRTINEIADELGLSPIFVADEVKVLEEYGFMDQTGDKYQTNMYILTPTKEYEEACHRLYCDAAEKIKKLYVPRVIDMLKSFDRSQVYIPDNDENLWLWSGIGYALGSGKLADTGPDDSWKFAVKRKDGGEYIASATVCTNFKLDHDERIYACCGNMTRGSDKYPISSWQITTNYDTREMGWRDNLFTDYEYLYELFTGKITKTPENIEKYERLRAKGYLTEDDRVNLICIKDSAKWLSDSAFANAIPEGGEEMAALADELAEEIYKLTRALLPEHMHPLCKAYSKVHFRGNGIRMRVIEQLVADGTLKLPTKQQAAGLSTILWTDVLPE